MKNTNDKITSLKIMGILGNVALKCASIKADGACIWLFHEPEVPSDLSKLKKR